METLGTHGEDLNRAELGWHMFGIPTHVVHGGLRDKAKTELPLSVLTPALDVAGAEHDARVKLANRHLLGKDERPIRGGAEVNGRKYFGLGGAIHVGLAELALRAQAHARHRVVAAWMANAFESDSEVKQTFVRLNIHVGGRRRLGSAEAVVSIISPGPAPAGVKDNAGPPASSTEGNDGSIWLWNARRNLAWERAWGVLRCWWCHRSRAGCMRCNPSRGLDRWSKRHRCRRLRQRLGLPFHRARLRRWRRWEAHYLQYRSCGQVPTGRSCSTPAADRAIRKKCAGCVLTGGDGLGRNAKGNRAYRSARNLIGADVYGVPKAELAVIVAAPALHRNPFFA